MEIYLHLRIKNIYCYWKNNKIKTFLKILNKIPDTCTFDHLKFNFMAGSNCNESSSQYKAGVTNEGQLVGYFCSYTVFDLSFLQFEIDVPPATNFILGKCTPRHSYYNLPCFLIFD